LMVRIVKHRSGGGLGRPWHDVYQLLAVAPKL
jgi:hypothetical protein